MRKLGLFGLAAAIVMVGCNGSSKSCTDAANAVAACNVKLGVIFTDNGKPLDAPMCDAASCTNKQGLIDCVAGLPCGNDAPTYAAGLVNCIKSNGCSGSP
jgi:hypothetical protein